MFSRVCLVGGVVLASLALTSCRDSSAPKRLLLTFDGNAGSVSYVAYSPDGKWIASCHEERPGSGQSNVPPPSKPPQYNALRAVKIWGARTGKEQVAINKGTLTGTIAIYPDGKSLAGAVGNTVRVWDTTAGKETLAFKGHTDEVRDLDVSRDGRWLASGSLDGTVKVWDARTGTCLHTLKGHLRGVLHVSLSPDGKLVAGSGGDRDREGRIRIWDWETEKEVLSVHCGKRIGKALFSPDGKHLAYHIAEIHKVTTPGLVEVRDASSGKLLFSREGHSEEVTCIAYSPGGEFLASGSRDSTVIVRDAGTGEEVLKLVPRGSGARWYGPLTCIAFSPRADRLVTASEDGTVKVWDVSDLTARKDVKAEKE